MYAWKSRWRIAANVLGYLIEKVLLDSCFGSINDRSLSANERCYKKVCEEWKRRYRVQIDPDEQICVAVAARYSSTDSAKCLTNLGSIPEKAGFNNRTMYRLKRKKGTVDDRILKYLGIESSE